MLPADGLPTLPAADLVAEAPGIVRHAGDVFVFHDPCVLGTRLTLAVTASGQAEAYAAACAARAEIDQLDAVFNWRDASSEISRLNRASRFEASHNLFAVVAAAERWREVSTGGMSGRLGLLLERWRLAEPGRNEVAALAQAIGEADVRLDAASRTIMRPEVVRFDLDAIAKGYIVDRAVIAAMRVAGVTGAILDIGGDIRCAGAGPDSGRWRVDVPDPLSTFDNAPLAGEMGLADAAIATSGCGPRDIGADGSVRSATLDPRTGWPIAHKRSATVIAPSAMEADALATAMLVLGEEEAERLATQLPGVSTRVTHPGGSRWIGAPQPHWVEYAPAPQPGQGAPSLWKQGWYADITFEAPPKDMRREIAFRSPYVVLWVSDMNDRPVRTLLLIGRYKEWHEGNHVWWRLNRAKVDSYFAGRSMSTRGSGTYKVYWDGSDDAGAIVAPGKYRLHVETSRESGGHEHRVLDLDFSRAKEFEAELPINANSGGLIVSFQKF
jgi:thiamine biosynthesis lipoprotein